MQVSHLAAYRIFEKKPPPKARKEVTKGSRWFKKATKKVTVIDMTVENGGDSAIPPPPPITP